MKTQDIPAIWSSYINVDNLEEILARVPDCGGQVSMPLMKVLAAGWMAFIQDPTGAKVALWQKNHHFGAAQVGDPRCFCWHELATRDVEAAKTFFGKLLGWTFELAPQSPTPYYLAKNQGVEVCGIMQMDERWGEMPPSWSVYFSVEDVDAMADSVLELGGAVLVPPFDIPIGRIAIVADPEGGHFNVFQFAGSTPG
jgi:predicted enzyme related to lactoylglutathione lyase